MDKVYNAEFYLDNLAYNPYLVVTHKVSNMNSMFAFCSSLKSVPLFNTEKVTNLSNMYELPFKLKI